MRKLKRRSRDNELDLVILEIYGLRIYMLEEEEKGNAYIKKKKKDHKPLFTLNK